ncbi:MAG: DHH family phosphoesterase [Candidatus Bathyarchaeota archaeon]|nr:DHH family phosphoesterase [Candidatus Bathyarchaeota archaeon]
MLEDFQGKGLLIHHWDTDGICSAALLLTELQGKDLTNWTPTIGAFYLTDDQIKWAQDFDYIIIADMSLPRENILALAEKTNVTIFDHHHQESIREINHRNPVAYGEPAEDYPSCTWVIKEQLSQQVNLYHLLGLIGDREHKIKDNPKFWKIIQNYCKEHETSFEELTELVQLIDSNQKVGDKDAVEEAPILLTSYSRAEDILKNGLWRSNLQRFHEKLKEVLAESPDEVNGVLMKRLHTKYSIISSVTRSIAWGTGRNTVIVNQGFFPQHDQLYARSSLVDMSPLIARAKILGFNAGGKKDVLGAIVPKESSDSFVKEVVEFLKE